MNNVKIFPIFNQAAPQVWDDFLRIRAVVMKHNYNLEMTSNELNAALDTLKNDWKYATWNFAFGAYDNNEMIGYICGTCDSKGKTAYFNHLYVMPNYQGKSIGRQLLNAAESAASVYATESELISLGNAYGFYDKNKYESRNKTNIYNKSLKNIGKCQVIPVFHAKPSMLTKLNRISQNTNLTKQAINKEHQPVFIYKDINQKITGYAFQNNAHSVSGRADDWAKTQLIKKLNAYLEHQNTR
jgi:GNAT superfamily N-acetyltransferase